MSRLDCAARHVDCLGDLYTRPRFASADKAHKAIYIAGYALIMIWVGMTLVME